MPYPTAQTVSNNAVAFIVNDWQNNGPSSLWIANVDGSGEKQSVANLEDSPYSWPDYFTYPSIQWSPNGKWLSYISKHGLWLVAPDGSTIKKVLSLPDLFAYKWSPDSSQIAYVQASLKSSQPSVFGILNIKSDSVSSSFDFEFLPLPLLISWVLNGQYLLLNYNRSLVLVDPTSGKVVKGSQTRACGDYGPITSPNGQWIATYEYETGAGGLSFCITKMESLDVAFSDSEAVSVPVWDSTGNILYYVDRDIVQNPGPNFLLRRYDVRTQQMKQLILLGRTLNFRSVSISPDGRTLQTHSYTSDNKESFIILDLKSMATTQYTVDLHLPFDSDTAWSSDSQKIVLFVGGIHTPDTTGVRPYGAFYTLDIHTGKTAVISGENWVPEWAVSPAVPNP